MPNRRRPAALARLLFVLVPLLAPTGALAEGEVTLPLSLYTALRQRLDTPEGSEPPVPACPVERHLEGRFVRGLLEGTLDVSFEVLDRGGWVEIPVLDASASLRSTTLDGRPASLRREGDLYVLGLAEPGRHQLKVRFYVGRQQNRFARRLELRLPPGGATSLDLGLPERDIVPRLRRGVLTQVMTTAEGTRLIGALDGSGDLELAWTRRMTHRAGGQVELALKQWTLFTVHEAVVQGLAVVDAEVVEGEADRFQLVLPEGLEVLEVEGDAVLQWHTERTAGGGARLTALLKHLVTDQVRALVHFQLPTPGDGTVRLMAPSAPEGVATSGVAGVLAPAGLEVAVQPGSGTQILAPRDLPEELTELSTSPLQLGVRFERSLDLGLTVSRRAEVELTGTVVDELEASTVLLEDGTEVTKLKLHMRNNTRQYLTLRLPEGATPTHALIDGQPTTPALSTAEPGALLMPLRQSERVGAGLERVHVVQPGDTLGAIANLYYSNPGRWERILDANRDRIASDTDLVVGGQLRIPALTGVDLEESRFVLELAYRRARPRLGAWGRLGLELPSLDVDAMKAVWHVYLPGALTPLAFDANLTQYTAVRYDPFRRLQSFWRRALRGRGIGAAWAGGLPYKSILARRKGIYAADARKRGRQEGVLASFPLVGERYRFKRILLGSEVPAVSVRYLRSELLSAVRWAALVVSLLLGLLALRRGAGAASRVSGVVGLVGLLVVGHYVLGTHKRIVWGVDLALAVLLLRHGREQLSASLRALLGTPTAVWSTLRVRTLLRLVAAVVVLALVAAFPLLLSSGALVILALLWWRARRSKQSSPPAAEPIPEVPHVA